MNMNLAENVKDERGRGNREAKQSLKNLEAEKATHLNARLLDATLDVDEKVKGGRCRCRCRVRRGAVAAFRHGLGRTRLDVRQIDAVTVVAKAVGPKIGGRVEG
jgi:hypothetical protein